MCTWYQKRACCQTMACCCGTAGSTGAPAITCELVPWYAKELMPALQEWNIWLSAWCKSVSFLFRKLDRH